MSEISVRDMWLVSIPPKRPGTELATPIAYYETEAEARAHQAQSRTLLRVELAQFTFADVPDGEIAQVQMQLPTAKAGTA